MLILPDEPNASIVTGVDKDGKSVKITEDQAEWIAVEILKLGLPKKLAVDMIKAAHKHVRQRWEFVMLGTSEMMEALRIFRQGERHLMCLDVFMTMCCNLDFNGKCSLNQQQIADELGKSKNNVSQAMCQMAKMGLITGTGKAGCQKTWRVNPRTAWRGAEPDRRLEMDDHDKRLTDWEREQVVKNKPGPKSKNDAPEASLDGVADIMRERASRQAAG